MKLYPGKRDKFGLSSCNRETFEIKQRPFLLPMLFGQKFSELPGGRQNPWFPFINKMIKLCNDKIYCVTKMQT